MPYTFYVKHDGAIYFLVNRDLNIFLFVIKDGKIFSCPHEQMFLIKRDP